MSGRGERLRAPARAGRPVRAALVAGAVVAAVLAVTPTRLTSIGAPPAGQPAPERIVSLVPSATEMLFAMGAGPQIVGVSSFDRFPPEVAALPKVGALVDPDFERILSLRPDLAVVYASQDEVIWRLTQARIPVFGVRHGGLSEITETLRELGQRAGRPSEADRAAANIERDLDRIRRRVADRPRPRTALLFGREPGTLRGLYVSAGVGFLHDMLVAAGGDDVFADVQRESMQVSAEALLARAPDVIVELRPAAGWDAARIDRELALWKRLPALPAVRAGRLHLLADDRLSIPGPRVAEAVALLADVLHPRAGDGR